MDMVHISLGERKKVPEIEPMLKKNRFSLAAAGSHTSPVCLDRG